MTAASAADRSVPEFDRRKDASDLTVSRIGRGEIGGKAQGLLELSHILQSGEVGDQGGRFVVSVPSMTVIGTEVYDAFIERNGMDVAGLVKERDDRIALAFQEASLPTEVLGDLRALIQGTHIPLAVRSSSLLEDALFRPFAGVYATKMIPNNQPDPDARFRKLMEAIKFVYASALFAGARAYIATTDKTTADEKMAVVIQPVVGKRYGPRYYPEVSGVARSYNYYAIGNSSPEDGVVSLALGLGKTVVDGEVCWSYSPSRPRVPPPFGSTTEMLRGTQVGFWAVNMSALREYDPLSETEHLVRGNLSDADYDGTLRHLASTYVASSDRIVPGTGAKGPRVIDFAPLLRMEAYPLNAAIQELLSACEKRLQTPVELEFAVSFPVGGSGPAEFGALQVRPMVVSEEVVDLSDAEMAAPSVLLSSDQVLGNGMIDDVEDIVYVKPDAFEASETRAVAREVEVANKTLQSEERPYLLIGFGRWGSSDPWLGIPIVWGQIGGARIIVEATLPEMNVELSQGSHFFHNLSSFGVCYFSVQHEAERGIDWQWLAEQEAVWESEYLRHVRLKTPLVVKVDGRGGRGLVEVPERQ